MKITFLVICISISALSIFSFSTNTLSQKVSIVSMNLVSFKIKNDTGTDHRIISSSGGSFSLDASSSSHTISMTVGDDVFLYDKGSKGAKILTVEADLKGKTILLSDLLK